MLDTRKLWRRVCNRLWGEVPSGWQALGPALLDNHQRQNTVVAHDVEENTCSVSHIPLEPHQALSQISRTFSTLSPHRDDGLGASSFRQSFVGIR